MTFRIQGVVTGEKKPKAAAASGKLRGERLSERNDEGHDARSLPDTERRECTAVVFADECIVRKEGITNGIFLKGPIQLFKCVSTHPHPRLR
jgi:hypothetical protein